MGGIATARFEDHFWGVAIRKCSDGTDCMNLTSRLLRNDLCRARGDGLHGSTAAGPKKLSFQRRFLPRDKNSLSETGELFSALFSK
jgi:hypothetical protein